MVNRDELKRGGLRAYEMGRLRVAARAAWVLVPAVLVCALETRAGETCVCLGVLLLAASIFLRWRDRRGAESVRVGLVAGLLPLVTGLVVARLAPNCAHASVASWCTAVCLGVGLPSGFWLGSRLARGTATTATRLASGGVAIVAASLGCVGLGVAGLFGATAGLAVGAASARVFVRTVT